MQPATIAKFNTLAAARSFVQRAEKIVMLVLGDDGLIWAVMPAEGERLVRAGYEYAPAKTGDRMQPKRRKEPEMERTMNTTKACPHCGNDSLDTIDLGDADRDGEGLRECGCGAVFTERADRDGVAAAYYNPRLGINLFRSAGAAGYMSVPGAGLT